MFLSTLSSKSNVPIENSPILKAVKGGLGITETSIIFSVSPLNPPQTRQSAVTTLNGFSSEFEIQGDVFVVKAACLDMALWKIGGAAVVLRLVQMANVSLTIDVLNRSLESLSQTPHQLSRALGILTDGLRNSWQNSEDMERLRRSKYQTLSSWLFLIHTSRWIRNFGGHLANEKSNDQYD
jgi:hypothetical protein